MAFKIKDLMINIAGKRTPEGCTGRQTQLQECTGHRTQPEECTGHRTQPQDCTGHRTQPQDCTGHRTELPDCTGRQTHVAICIGGRSEIGVCVGGLTYGGGGCAGRLTLGECANCTKKTTIRELSPVCGPGEMLDELNAIKAQLQAELAEVDDEIKQVEDTLKPKTVAEVEELQTKLHEALDELGKMKADLEKN
jgi:hypothetical protein